MQNSASRAASAGFGSGGGTIAIASAPSSQANNNNERWRNTYGVLPSLLPSPSASTSVATAASVRDSDNSNRSTSYQNLGRRHTVPEKEPASGSSASRQTPPVAAASEPRSTFNAGRLPLVSARAVAGAVPLSPGVMARSSVTSASSAPTVRTNVGILSSARLPLAGTSPGSSVASTPHSQPSPSPSKWFAASPTARSSVSHPNASTSSEKPTVLAGRVPLTGNRSASTNAAPPAVGSATATTMTDRKVHSPPARPAPDMSAAIKTFNQRLLEEKEVEKARNSRRYSRTNSRESSTSVIPMASTRPPSALTPPPQQPAPPQRANLTARVPPTGSTCSVNKTPRISPSPATSGLTRTPPPANNANAAKTATTSTATLSPSPPPSRSDFMRTSKPAGTPPGSNGAVVKSGNVARASIGSGNNSVLATPRPTPPLSAAPTATGGTVNSASSFPRSNARASPLNSTRISPKGSAGTASNTPRNSASPPSSQPLARPFASASARSSPNSNGVCSSNATATSTVTSSVSDKAGTTTTTAQTRVPPPAPPPPPTPPVPRSNGLPSRYSDYGDDADHTPPPTAAKSTGTVSPVYTATEVQERVPPPSPGSTSTSTTSGRRGSQGHNGVLNDWKKIGGGNGSSTNNNASNQTNSSDSTSTNSPHRSSQKGRPTAMAAVLQSHNMDDFDDVGEEAPTPLSNRPPSSQSKAQQPASVSSPKADSNSNNGTKASEPGRAYLFAKLNQQQPVKKPTENAVGTSGDGASPSTANSRPARLSSPDSPADAGDPGTSAPSAASFINALPVFSSTDERRPTKTSPPPSSNANAKYGAAAVAGGKAEDSPDPKAPTADTAAKTPSPPPAGFANIVKRIEMVEKQKTTDASPPADPALPPPPLPARPDPVTTVPTLVTTSQRYPTATTTSSTATAAAPKDKPATPPAAIPSKRTSEPGKPSPPPPAAAKSSLANHSGPPTPQRLDSALTRNGRFSPQHGAGAPLIGHGHLLDGKDTYQRSGSAGDKVGGSNDADAEAATLNAYLKEEELNLSMSTFNSVGSTLAQSLNLRVLNLNGSIISSEGLRGLANIPTLKSICVSHMRNLTTLVPLITPTTGNAATAPSRCSIEEIDAQFSNINNEGIRGLEKMRRLRRLDLSMTPVSNVTCLTGSVCLKDLYLTGTRVDAVGIAGLEKVPTLVTLNIARTKVTSLRQLAKSRSLQTLILYSCQVTNSGFVGVADMPRLATLDVSTTKIEDLSVLQTSRSLKSIKAQWLALKNCQDIIQERRSQMDVGSGAGPDDSVAWRDTEAGYAGLASIPTLESVDLSFNTLRSFHSLCRSRSLKHLYLRRTRTDNSGIGSVAQLAPTLETLVVTNLTDNLDEDEEFDMDSTASGLLSLIGDIHVLRHLTCLDLSYTDVYDLRLLQDISTLRELVIVETLVTVDGMRGIERIASLEVLDLSQTSILSLQFLVGGAKGLKKLLVRSNRNTNGFCLGAVHELPALEHLDLSDTVVEDMESVPKAQWKLKELVWRWGERRDNKGPAPALECWVTSLRLAKLHAMPCLTLLDLTNSRVHNLTFLSRSATLKTLHLRLCKLLRDAAATELGTLAALEVLYLTDNTHITDVTCLRSCRKLRELYLDNTRVNTTGLKGLMDLPELKVLSIVNTRAEDEAMGGGPVAERSRMLEDSNLRDGSMMLDAAATPAQFRVPRRRRVSFVANDAADTTIPKAP